jgi:hypothetical protein
VRPRRIGAAELSDRRFPPPWSIEEQPACFVVRDHSGQKLAYVYFENEPGRRTAAKLEGPMTSEAEAKFLKEFGPRRDAMLGRLQKAAGVGKPKPMSLGDLEVLAAASMELLTTALANMPEPRRGEIVKGLSTTMAADVARKREWLEQKIPGRRLDTLKGSA